MRVSEALDEFLLVQKLRGNSPATLTYYRAAILPFVTFAGDPDVDQIDVYLCRRWHLALLERELSSTSVQSYVRALRAFLTWLHDEELHQQNVAKRFKLPKADRKVVHVLDDDEIRRVFDACLCLRDRAMVSLMLDSGLRLSEVAGARREKLNLKEHYLIVFGKGHKERVVPFGDATASLMSELLGDRAGTPGPIFNAATHDGVSPETVKRIFKRLRRRSGVDRLGPHLLRHTFGTRFSQLGGDSYMLRDILGHTSLYMVQHYRHLARSYIPKNYRKFSPIDRLEDSDDGDGDEDPDPEGGPF